MNKIHSWKSPYEIKSVENTKFTTMTGRNKSAFPAQQRARLPETLILADARKVLYRPTRLIQIIWSCEMPEYELAAKKQLKVCKNLGTYCDSKAPITGLCLVRKECYCCYNSPLARILNEQIKPQLGMDFGTPEKPECLGIKVADLDKVDWNQDNLDEWLGLLALTNHLPTEQNAASLLNPDQLTGTGSRLDPAKYWAVTSNRQDTLTRTQGRMTGLDAPTVKRLAEQEGWGMGP